MEAAFWTLVGVMIAGMSALFVDSRSGYRSLRGDISGLDTKMDGLRTELKGDISGLRTELKGDISGLDTKMDGLRTELKGDISELRTELTGEIRAQTARIDQQTARIDVLVIDVGEMKGDLRALATRVAALELHQV
ncbi:MAG: hypothetical protein ACYCPR_12290 [Thermoplasmataceae archaeon]